MPGPAIKAHFLDSQEWVVGLKIVSPHDVTVREGIIVEVPVPRRDITIGDGSDVEVT